MKHYTRNILKILLLFVCIFMGYCVFLFLSFNPHNDPFEERYSKSMFDRNGKILSVFLNANEQWHIKNNAPINDKLKIATLTFEDKNFYSHSGFDIFAILRSLYINLTQQKRVGGSTITMQTIKLLTNDKRTYFNKFKEIIWALRLESLYSKDEILAMYLNNAPYGGNIVGISSAALMYFRKDTQNLTWSEAALLAVLPNAPGLIHTERNSDILIQKRNRLLLRLKELKYIDDDNLKLAMSEKIPRIHRERNLAAHLALRFDKESIINSTIDKHIQTMLEERLKSHHKKLLGLGIQNLAAIIVDTQSSEVLGYAGSQDFLDIQGMGQIDGILAKRSPGSVLKPLLYALSIDDGLIAPQSKLVDAPTYFSNFKPQNASKKYYGLVSARNALIKSLNVPFVSLLQEYGYERFFFDLKNIVGFSDNNFERYGLSLILGTKELSIEDVAKIYVGLGNYGEFGEIYYRKDTPKGSKRRILSQGSSYLTLDAMRYLDRVGLENRYINKKIFSWKTGTSYGRKDAWAAGTSPRYTIVVWAGNFSGESNPNIFGLNIAGDILFDILGDLGDTGGEFKRVDDLKNITLDLPTGYRYNAEYKDIQSFEGIYPKSAKNLRYSPFLKNVFVDSNLREINSLDKDFIHAKEMTKVILPLALLEYYKEQNLRIAKQAKSLQILYPKNNLTIIRTKDFEGENELIVRIANINNQNVFWYLDKQYIGFGKQTTHTLSLAPGNHTLTIINEEGQSDSVKFVVAK